MAITVDELAYLVDSALDICIENETTGQLSLVINGLQVRVGAGPQLRDVEGNGLTTNDARNDYAGKVQNQVVVLGGNPRGLEVRVPVTIIGFEPTGESGATGP
jgi:hypothetical protein